MSCNEIIDELELLKKNLVFSLTKYSLTGEDDYNNEIVKLIRLCKRGNANENASGNDKDKQVR